MNVADCLRNNAISRPKKIALRQGTLSIDYLHLNARVNRLANGLKALGLEKGMVVAVILPSCHEHLEALFALAKIGVICLPIDTRWDSEEIERSLNHFEAVAVIFGDGNLESILKIRERIEMTNGRLISTARGIPPTIVGYEDFLARGTEMEPDSVADEFDIFLVGLSSGTTGVPKGTAVTHRNLIFRWMGQIVEFGMNATDIFLNLSPMAYSAGRSFAMSHLYVGATVIIAGERFDPRASMESIHQQEITTCFMVPTMYHRVLQLPDIDRFDTSSLRALVSSGARIPALTQQQIVERLTPHFYNYFGSIEAGGVSLLKPEDVALKGNSVGRGVFNTEIRIVDEKGSDVPRGAIGRIIVRGPAVAEGYYKHPEATEEYFRDGWCRVGDLGRMDEDGYLYLEGREKEMIIRGGVNIYPDEIEHTLMRHPLVNECAVIGVPDREFGEEIAAVITLHPGKAITPDELEMFCRGHLAPYKRPKIVRFVDDLPRTSSGKLRKNDLKEMI